VLFVSLGDGAEDEMERRLAFRGRKIWIRVMVKGDKEQGPATAYAHLLKQHDP
jgi:hypothetical protein